MMTSLYHLGGVDRHIRAGAADGSRGTSCRGDVGVFALAVAGLLFLRDDPGAGAGRHDGALDGGRLWRRGRAGGHHHAGVDALPRFDALDRAWAGRWAWAGSARSSAPRLAG